MTKELLDIIVHKLQGIHLFLFPMSSTTSQSPFNCDPPLYIAATFEPIMGL